MELTVITLEGGEDGRVSLSETLFGLEPRADILHRVVRWQRNKAMQGTHSTKTRSETNFSKRKIYRQKGVGRARHGDRNAPIFRGGGVYKGPTPRSHAHKLTKKFRALGLRHALSAKAVANEIVVLDKAVLESGRTSALVSLLKNFGWRRTLIIDGKEVNTEFAKAASNLGQLSVLPVAGANVYDILRSNTLVITKAGLAGLEEKLR